MQRLATAVALGFILGWAAAHALFLHWWTLVPWGVAALALGYRANRAGAVTAGAVYGFVLCFVFTLATYGGAAPAITRVPFFTVLGPIGTVAGVKSRLGRHMSPQGERTVSRGRYEQDECRLIEQVLSPADVVLEVGAGLGLVSAYCAKRLGSSRVFAYEANPDLEPC